MKGRNEVETGSYFGIEVEVVVVMNGRSLIRYRDRETIVDTDDVVPKQVLKKAA